MKERRKSPRTRCRLPCQIRRGGERVRARVLDVSDSGVCILSPVEVKKGQEIEIEVDVPSHGPAKIKAEVWHVRRIKSKATRRWTWTAGMILHEADNTFAHLYSSGEATQAADSAESSAAAQGGSDAPAVDDPCAAPGRTSQNANAPKAEDPSVEQHANELQVFRVRVQMKGAPRTRLLTLAAGSEDEAQELAMADLDDAWLVTEVREASDAA